jgi:hypothetical protein
MINSEHGRTAVQLFGHDGFTSPPGAHRSAAPALPSPLPHTEVRRHRCRTGSRWRRLSTGRQALLTLARLRSGHATPGSRPGRHRPHDGLPLRHRGCPTPPRSRPACTDAGWTASVKACPILDGTLPPVDRIAEGRPFCSGKHKKHGTNGQVLAAPSADCCGPSPALSGTVHDFRAAREHDQRRGAPRGRSSHQLTARMKYVQSAEKSY